MRGGGRPRMPTRGRPRRLNPKDHTMLCRVHYGWYVALACMAMTFCSSFLCGGFGVILSALREEYGLTGTEASMITTLRSVVGFFVLFGSKWYYRRFGLRGGMAIAMGAGMVANLVFLSARGSVLAYHAGGVIAGVMYAYGIMMSASMLIKRWFNNRRVVATSIVASGLSASMMISPTLVQWIIDTRGVETAFVFEAACFALAGLIILVVVRDTPDKLGLEPVGGPEEHIAASAVRKGGVTLTQGWLFAVTAACFLVAFVSSPAVAHFSLVFVDEGFDPDLVAHGISTFGTIYLVGALAYGRIAERLTPRVTCIACGIATSISLVMFALTGMTGSIPLMFATFLVVGVGYPVVLQGYPTWAADFSSGDNYDATLKRFQMGYQVGSMVGALVPGVVADVTGHYYWAFAGYAVLFAVLVATVALAYREKNRLLRG